MALNGEPVSHKGPPILVRMRGEIEAICEGAQAIWQGCLAQSRAQPVSRAPLVLTGCGDSYYAGLAIRGALEMELNVPVVAWPAMEVIAHPSVLLEGGTLVGVSVSGKVGRTIDALAAHAGRGGTTVAVTAYHDSDLAKAADSVIATGVRGTPGPVPGTANYVASMLGLLSLAASGPESAALDRSVSDALALLPAVLEASLEFCELAADEAQEPFFIVGSGPDWGTANFAVAKLLEAAGAVAVPQDLEEWAHEQYFVTRPDRTVLVFSGGTETALPAQRVTQMVSAVGGRPILVGGESRGELSAYMKLPDVTGRLNPLIGWVPAAVFALTFAERNGRFPFGLDQPGRMATVDSNIYIPSPSRM